MNVGNAMTPRSEVVTVEIPGTRDDALEYLQDEKFSSVPVVKTEDGEETFRGIVTREALIKRPNEDQLALLMEEVPTISQESTIEQLAELVLETGERRIPVCDNGSLAGIVTVTDVLGAIADGAVNGDTPVSDLFDEVVTTVYAGTPLPVAERVLSYAAVPYAVVLDDDGGAVGMLTEVDIVDVARVVQGEADPGDAVANQDDEWMWEGIKAVGSRSIPTLNVEIPSEPVSEFMSADLVTVSGQKSARETAQIMLSNDIEQLPVMEAGELVGIVRDVDLLRSVTS
ncbi:MAG: CBS domain-containing protein [Natronomonas sp.]